MTAARTRDAGNRLRYHGQARRGRPRELRAAAVDLAHAGEALTRARVGLEAAAQVEDERRRGDLVADAKAHALLAVRFTRAAFKRQLPKAPKVVATQLRLKLTRKGGT